MLVTKAESFQDHSSCIVVVCRDLEGNVICDVVNPDLERSSSVKFLVEICPQAPSYDFTILHPKQH